MHGLLVHLDRGLHSVFCGAEISRRVLAGMRMRLLAGTKITICALTSLPTVHWDLADAARAEHEDILQIQVSESKLCALTDRCQVLISGSGSFPQQS